MKVLIVGGYGVFGGRLARLLLKDRVDVIVAGRDFERACAFTSRFGGSPFRVDVSGDLTPLANAGLAAVVDAAGPFQAYDGDPYRLARFCIENGISYLDLSDDAAFTQGIAELDATAKAAGCFALSGVSSVPAISAAAVRALSADFSEILVIETALVPGNRAPRGRSVVASILSQTGEPLQVWRGGAWRPHRGWSDSRTVSFGPGFERKVSLIGVPDLKLFPQAFASRSVIFRAGLELAVMRWALASLGFLRSRHLLPTLTFFLAPILWLSQRLEHLGSDRGAMAVDVVGQGACGPLRRRWQIVASDGDGPFIPAVAARAILRNFASIQPGARPCLSELSLQEIEGSLEGLSVQTSVSSAPAPTLFQKALGERWKALPASVQRLHSVQDIEVFRGRAKVTRGKGVIERAAAFFFNFPDEADDVPVAITKTKTPFGEIWERDFGGRKFRSILTPSSRPYHYRERFFAFDYALELPVENGILSYPVRRGWFLGIPLPRFLLPESKAREYELDGTFHFDVGLYAPLTGHLIVRYEGHFVPV